MRPIDQGYIYDRNGKILWGFCDILDDGEILKKQGFDNIISIK
jgi:hypothetical protein